MSQLKLSTEGWSNQTVFIMAAIGSAVGLGNIWKFPYITGENGGGAFVLVYLACILLIGIPVLMSEIALGRAGKANPVQAMANLARENNASRLWFLLGLNGVLASALILSFYTVIAGWATSYFFESLQGTFIGIDSAGVDAHFKSLLANPYELLFWHSLISLVTVLIVSQGVKSGLERAISWMMPGLLLILLILLGYATTTGAFGQSFAFLFSPDFSKLSWEAVLIAMGHAFFTLSIGLGVMMVYGSYVSQQYSIVKASLWIAAADTLVALMAGLVIFSIVFSNGMEAGAGPGLLFQTLPIAFGQMTGGWFFGTLFFAFVVVAALSSAISLLEPVVSWFEQNWGINRVRSAWILGFLIWLFGIGSLLSFNEWSGLKILGDRNIFNSVDFITANIMLPMGGLLISIFVAWVLSSKQRRNEIELNEKGMMWFLFDLKWIAPVAILIVFASNLVSSDSVWLMIVVALAAYGIFIFNSVRKS
ncbi:sodium-dependent transporter [Thiomicrorhabdus sp. ZW0627]|uniref:sodium-dependent transporter n=1 Tax=Thiomicrorhabdus sp. ZW0627 TaxID=3039774 RepID=UPI002436ABD8|nr:sodium-dependent transporter [Thiomicrorhabdus sp. ZW0627]MDG6773013.1 sodium-dependent transporter [Thiomicrorhabdus sp. ZW0627]